MLVIHVDFEGQDHRPKFTDTKGNVAKVVGATSSESFLVSLLQLLFFVITRPKQRSSVYSFDGGLHVFQRPEPCFDS